ncbi:enoyl-CoA hydratase/isomerase family protein [Kribbella jejuensis]|uniref:Enoyl-CoA hydratase n=1 Tax=Kribbella jejuensis TaxID=236068 RepID=A0A542E976_9ACTN|nr:enoyl-CoA hydratase/isomerase family protein [Kribbella jejuensis]TQJ11864.1 enoyl-CoA hydratase [Kribbella jejuensis]
MSDEVLFERREHVAIITLNRPAKLNAVTAEMSDTLVELARECNESDDVRAVVLTGTGRAFSAGSDIRELDKYPTPWAFRNRADYCDSLKVLRKPVVAAVNGFALGGGLETALICDIRIASTAASFAAAEVKLGWIGGGGMSALLTHNIGPGNAALMLMTGDPIDAQRALSWGLVSEVVEPEALLPSALKLATTIASRAPIGVETAKANVAAALNMPLEQAVAYERDVQTICFATQDATEGRAAFAEKREPRFSRA